MRRSAQQIQLLSPGPHKRTVNLAYRLIARASRLRASEHHALAGGRGSGWVGTVIKFPDDGRIVRFGREADESATIIILPVIRIERYPESFDGIEPQTQPPAENGGRRRVRRR